MKVRHNTRNLKPPGNFRLVGSIFHSEVCEAVSVRYRLGGLLIYSPE